MSDWRSSTTSRRSAADFLPLYLSSHRFASAIGIGLLSYLPATFFTQLTVFLPSLGVAPTPHLRTITAAIFAAILTRPIASRTPFDCADTGTLARVRSRAALVLALLGSAFVAAFETLAGTDSAAAHSSLFAVCFALTVAGCRWMDPRRSWIIAPASYAIFHFFTPAISATPLAFLNFYAHYSWSPVPIAALGLGVLASYAAARRMDA